ncbi:hypothetical protein BCR44DRAFT_1432438, partial [Catenaria anguillulae PL171]
LLSRPNPTLTGRNFVITGANTGIGWITAREIAKHGGNVILACRSQEKAEAAIAKIQSELAAISASGIGSLEFLPLDLQSLESFWHQSYGPFVFTMLLLPLIPKGADAKSRIINLSSLAHTMPYSTGLLELDQIMVWPQGEGSTSNLLFTKYLARHLPSSIQCFAVHPGYVDTELGRNLSSSYGSVVGTVAKGLAAVVAKSPESGAVTTLEGIKWAPSGTYFVPQGKVGTPSKFAMDERLADKLWDMSLEITKRVLGDKVVEEIKANLAA